MIKTIVTGAGGRMGGRIISLLSAVEGMELTGAIEQKGHDLIGKDIGEKLGLGTMGVIIHDDIMECVEKGNVIIDFSHHTASLKNLEIAALKKRAIVIGSTGFTAEEMGKVKELTMKTRCVLSPNMSIGVNVLFKVLEYVAGILGNDYDVEIVEAHHNLKKDAPSGTALKMAQIISGKLGRDLDRVGVYSRKGMIGARTKEEIGIQTLRAGDIVGDHMVMFGGIGERLEFTHRAHSRDNFARGAILAAKWIVNQKDGLYDMQDVLGIRGK